MADCMAVMSVYVGFEFCLCQRNWEMRAEFNVFPVSQHASFYRNKYLWTERWSLEWGSFHSQPTWKCGSVAPWRLTLRPSVQWLGIIAWYEMLQRAKLLAKSLSICQLQNHWCLVFVHGYRKRQNSLWLKKL